jgi:SlyX protein
MSSERITELETKLAFVEGTVTELSDLLYRQQQTVDELRTWCRTLAERMTAMRGNDGESFDGHEPPPHY